MSVLQKVLSHVTEHSYKAGTQTCLSRRVGPSSWLSCQYVGTTQSTHSDIFTEHRQGKLERTEGSTESKQVYCSSHESFECLL